MKKFLLTCICFVGATLVFAACGLNSSSKNNSSSSNSSSGGTSNSSSSSSSSNFSPYENDEENWTDWVPID